MIFFGKPVSTFPDHALMPWLLPLQAICDATARLWINQDARIEHSPWIQFALGCPQGGSEKLRPLPVVPGPVVAADGMVMGDGAARRDQRIACRVLDGLPLL